MSFTGTIFTGYVFDTYEATAAKVGDGIQVRGLATYTVNNAAVNAAYIANWKDPSKLSFMLGLYVNKNQDLTVEYADLAGNYFPLDKEASPGGKLGIVDDLEKNFGVAADKKWIGFSQPTGKNWALMDQLLKSIAQFEIRITITATAGPEFIPFVSRHLNDPGFTRGSFEKGYMSSAWYVPVPVRMTAGKRWVFGPRGKRWLD